MASAGFCVQRPGRADLGPGAVTAFRRPENAKGGQVLAIGNFDGVHLGHQSVLRAAAAEAARRGLPLGVLTFSPHPREFFQPEKRPHALFPLAERMRQLRARGVERITLQRFDAAFSRVKAADFMQLLLQDRLGAAHIFTGEDFTFGHRREGDSGLLRRFAEAKGIGYSALPPVMWENAPVSSTRIRHALAEGRIEQAAALLGRAYDTRAMVQRGRQLGRNLGYPTANMALPPRYYPALGIYAVQARPEGEIAWRPGVASFGRRPTFDNGRLLLEVHLLDLPAPLDLYDRHLEVRWLRFLRAEQKFDSAADLRRQMDIDADRARAWLHSPEVAAL